MAYVAGTPNGGPILVIPISGTGTVGSDTVDSSAVIDGSIVNADVANSATIKQEVIRFPISGDGFAITTGVKAPHKTMPFACTINSWKIISDVSGSIVFDIWKAAFATGSIPSVANTITASAKPTLSSAFGATSSTLTGWTTSVSAGDTIVINVDSASTTTAAVLELAVTLT